jgi:3-methyladenine DNA glycosylase/8-oxoguanine DNA glycosylase
MTWFHDIVTSHGWYQLAPFRYEGGALKRLHTLPDGHASHLTICAEGDALRWSAREPVADPAAIDQAVRRMFSLDWNLEPFHALLRRHPRYAGRVQPTWGRLLVAPTVWEDLVKTLLTTNTTWAQTRQMTARVCAFGTPYDGGHTFPTPQQIAAVPFDDFAARARLGYRAAALHELARRICDGLDVEAWRALDSEALYQQVRGLRGFGDYAAGTVLRLLGHFDRLAIDTECRAAFRRVTGRAAFTDADIRAYYADFGAWQGLMSWIDIMHSEENT